MTVVALILFVAAEVLVGFSYLGGTTISEYLWAFQDRFGLFAVALIVALWTLFLVHFLARWPLGPTS